MEQIQNYKIVPIGTAKNYCNQIIGDVKVLYRTEPPTDVTYKKPAFWLCQCNKCKEYKIIRSNILNKNQYHCNCKDNITNQKFHHLTALFPTEKRSNNGSIIWHCKCDCGEECDVSSNDLKTGNIKTCGCSRKINISNQRFGKLIALYSTQERASNGSVVWYCQCNCGNTTKVPYSDLINHKTESCGCTRSKNEENIIQLLNNNNISFKTQYTFQDLPNKRFDFYINNSYIIEFDGQQHFNYSNTGWNTREQFEKTRKSDLIKNKYCFNKDIPIIRIPYDVEYDIKDLQLETTNFLLTKDNEKEYYERP